MGIPLEMVHGSLRVVGVYFMGIIAGSLGSSVVDPRTNIVGASAGVYALVGAHVADLYINWAEMPYRWLRAFFLGSLTIADTSISLYQRYGLGNKATSYAGHFFGFVMGITLGVVILHNLRETQYELWAKRIGIVLAIVGFIIALFFNIFYPDYPQGVLCNV